MTSFHRLNTTLGAEFDRYVLDHPAFGARIPRRAEVVLQLEGHPGFNAWQRRLGELNHEKGRPIVIVTVGRLRPAKSRLVRPRLKQVAAA